MFIKKIVNEIISIFYPLQVNSHPLPCSCLYSSFIIHDLLSFIFYIDRKSSKFKLWCFELSLYP